ncbi:MAG: HNH endonuclease signature motif containing protein [Desulfobacteraceae bacterium]
MRNRNTNAAGDDWTRKQIDLVWQKAKVVEGFDPDEIRQDECDTWIRYSQYGEMDRNGNGWEIDHIKPVSMNGTDDLSNLQPLQWENNRFKGDNWPTWKCAKVAR